MFIFSLLIALVASDQISFNRALNHANHHRAANFNRVRFGGEAFAGMKLRNVRQKPNYGKKARKVGRKFIRNRMQESFRRNLFG